MLVSGRTFEQVIEAARIFAADGAIAELGATVAWDAGRGTHRLRGELPEGFGDRTPMAAMAELGIVEELIAAAPGPAGVARALAHHPRRPTPCSAAGSTRSPSTPGWPSAALGWLTLKDNGAIPATSRMTLDDDPLPPHVYHLMPRGITKGAAIAWDLERRGLTAADAVAIGDSVSDLEMAPAVGRLWITANGAAVDGMVGAASTPSRT